MRPLRRTATHATRDRAETRIDRAFARFVRRGDAEALAEVFDFAAPKLMLVAVRFRRDRDRAEDLVQQTFLELIRAAPRFEPERPVMPFLWSIFAKVSASAQRAEGRRTMEDESPVSVPSRDRAEPIDELAARETVDRVRKAIESIPAGTREVLRLHLLHGLRAVEIADALERPVGTVYAQLHRGLEKLRRGLPTSMASIVGALLTASNLAASVEAVRGSVVAAAEASGPVVASVAASSSSSLPSGVGAGVLSVTGVVMAKWIFGVVAVALATVGILSSFHQEPPAEVPNEPESRVAARETTEDRAKPEDPATPTRRAVSIEEAIRVEGRILDENGEPLSGARVALHTGATNGEPDRSVGDGIEETSPLRLSTGADGGYLFEVDPTTTVNDTERWRVEAQADGRIVRWAGFERPEPGGTHEVEDLRLLRASELSFRVTTSSDRPKAGVDLLISSDGIEDYFMSTEGDATRTDATGLLTLPRPVAFGRYRVQSTWPLFGPKTVVVDSPTTVVGLEAPDFPDDRDRIEGLVVDESGDPIRSVGVEPSVRRHDGLDTYQAIYTDDAGRFVVPRFRAGEAETTDLEFSSNRHLAIQIERIAWGRSDVVVSMQSLPDLSIRVVSTEPGDPVEDFGFRFRVVEQFHPGPVAYRLWERTHMPEGLARLGAAVPGRYQVRVFPRPETGCAASGVVEIDTRDLDGPVEILVEPGVPREVFVVDPEGEPVPDMVVSLVELGVGRSVTVPGNIGHRSRGTWKPDESYAWVKTVTDAEGRTRVVGSRDGRFALSVAPRSNPQLELSTVSSEGLIPFDFATDQPATIVVRSGRDLIIRLEDGLSELWTARGGDGLRGSVTRSRDGELRSYLHHVQGPELRFSGLEPGDYDVDIGFEERSVSLGTVSVLPGEEPLVIPLSRTEWAPARVEGVLRIDAGRRPWNRIEAVRYVDGEFGLMWPIDRVIDGEFSRHLLPGTYVSRVPVDLENLGTTSGSETRLQLPVFEVRAGQPMRLDWDLTVVRRVLELLDSEGQPVAGRRIRLEPASLPEGLPSPPTPPSDELGRIELFAFAGFYRAVIEGPESEFSERTVPIELRSGDSAPIRLTIR